MRILFFILFLVTYVGGNFAVASPGNMLTRSSVLTRSPHFAEVPELRPRINFWIDVFTKYGEKTIVLHHRDYPQAVFEVVDLSREAVVMSPRKFAVFKKSKEKLHVNRIKDALRRLADGHSPSTPLERTLVDEMKIVPGGVTKYSKAVKDNLVRTQTGIREKFEASIIRSGRYMPTIEKIFSEYGLPIELTRLPFVESSFDYKAYSSVGAAGIWQFMPRTARLFKLKISSAIDERRDPIEATKAAANYLLQAYNELGSWPLALTSYNHGIYGVKKAVRAMGTTNIAKIIEHNGKRVFGFASNNFYPEFLAALEVYDHYNDYFPGLKIEAPIQFREVKLSRPYSIHSLTKSLSITKESLRSLNYAISEAAYSGRVAIPGGYNLKVPLYASQKELPTSNEPSYTMAKVAPESRSLPGSVYTVRKGDTLGKIASRFKVTVSDLISENSLRNKTIRVGQKIVIPEVAPVMVASNIKARTNFSSPAFSNSRRHIVRSGDSMWKISKRYGVSVNRLVAANKLKNTQLKVGQKLLIP